MDKVAGRQIWQVVQLVSKVYVGVPEKVPTWCFSCLPTPALIICCKFPPRAKWGCYSGTRGWTHSEKSCECWKMTRIVLALWQWHCRLRGEIQARFWRVTEIRLVTWNDMSLHGYLWSYCWANIDTEALKYFRVRVELFLITCWGLVCGTWLAKFCHRAGRRHGLVGVSLLLRGSAGCACANADILQTCREAALVLAK